MGDLALPPELTVERCLEQDAREEFPDEICRSLTGLGVEHLYLPGVPGERLLALIRSLAGRDFTVALAHCKTYLGSVATWVGGTLEQVAALAARVSGGAVVSLALTERDHGSDVLAGEVTATPVAGGYRLDGEKWLINNATRADVVCVLARTGNSGDARGFSLFLVDKDTLPAHAYRCLPMVATHGVRGADISGIRFTGAVVPPGAMIGEPGTGLEILLKGLQITRTLCGGMSLGMGEHAVRIVLDFAERHRMYGGPLADLPLTTRALADSYVDLLVAEAVTLVSTRSIHSLTGEQSLISAVVKYYVPTLIDRTLQRLAKVLGARALLTDGAFQKIWRDHAIVGVFDGNTWVNLNTLVNQFPALVRGYRGARVDEEGLAAATGLKQPLPPLDPGRLSLAARDGCSLVQSLAGNSGAPQELRDRADRLHSSMAGWRPRGREVPPELFGLAREYARLYAAAACVRLWADNALDDVWLRACLARVFDRPDAATDHLLNLMRRSRTFSFLRGVDHDA
ncbi:acyl-CoA dehydrogenase [Nonomuraea angiospora]|uniref:acyl-CoA dehydrogenase n=1 Tax=Nonomuraea angiospora TaxID=46172 RepID=UPI0029B06CB2|nr:acyl-CoA dehydrogenase [Nonomuraea angiospora]MDX3100854.1 acyl-CoA dehydrogenase [Nonomuraea angiospora]